MKKLRCQSRNLIDEIPAQDRAIVRDLECVFDAKVKIRWTSEGFRYDVRFP